MSAVLDRNWGAAIIDHYGSPEDRLAVKEKGAGNCLKFTLHVFSGANKKNELVNVVDSQTETAVAFFTLVVDGDVTLVIKLYYSGTILVKHRN